MTEPNNARDVSRRELRGRIRSVLENCPGKANAIKCDRINELCGEVDNGDSNPRIRKEVRYLIDHGILPIGGGGHEGYYLIETKEEENETLARLDSRAKSIENRKTSLKGAVAQRRETTDQEYPRKEQRGIFEFGDLTVKKLDD